MFRLFVSKLPKSASAKEVEDFLVKLFPEAGHIQVLHGSHSGTHKGHAYAHFSSGAVVTDVLRRMEGQPPPTLHEASIQIKRASLVDAPEHGGASSPRRLPPQLAQYTYTVCACFCSSAVESLEGVVARCELADGVTVVAFGSEAQMAAALETCPGGASKCLPPILPEILSPHFARKRGRSNDNNESNDDSGDGVEGKAHDSRSVTEEDDKPTAVENELDVVESYKRRGFVPLPPAAALTLMRDFMEGQGRIALKDQRGHIVVMNLPAHASGLE